MAQRRNTLLSLACPVPSLKEIRIEKVAARLKSNTPAEILFFPDGPRSGGEEEEEEEEEEERKEEDPGRKGGRKGGRNNQRQIATIVSAYFFPEKKGIDLGKAIAALEKKNRKREKDACAHRRMRRKSAGRSRRSCEQVIHSTRANSIFCYYL